MTKGDWLDLTVLERRKYNLLVETLAAAHQARQSGTLRVHLVDEYLQPAELAGIALHLTGQLILPLFNLGVQAPYRRGAGRYDRERHQEL